MSCDCRRDEGHEAHIAPQQRVDADPGIPNRDDHGGCHQHPHAPRNAGRSSVESQPANNQLLDRKQDHDEYEEVDCEQDGNRGKRLGPQRLAPEKLVDIGADPGNQTAGHDETRPVFCETGKPGPRRIDLTLVADLSGAVSERPRRFVRNVSGHIDRGSVIPAG